MIAIPHSNTTPLTSDLQSPVEAHPLHVIIPSANTVQRPHILRRETTFGHGHPGIASPHADVPMPSPDTATTTPGHGHPGVALFALASPSTPVRRRPSARASRMSNFFAGQPAEGEEGHGDAPLSPMHPLVDAAHAGFMSPLAQGLGPHSEEEEDGESVQPMDGSSIQPMQAFAVLPHSVQPMTPTSVQPMTPTSIQPMTPISAASIHALL